MLRSLPRPACSWCATTTLACCTAAPAYTVELITAAGTRLPLHACTVHLGELLERSLASPGIAYLFVHPARDEVIIRGSGMTDQLPPGAPLALQEALRTVGAGLEGTQTRHAELIVSSLGIAVTTRGAYGYLSWSPSHRWSELANQSAARRRLRQREPSPARRQAALTLARWSVLLRAIGQQLDARGIRHCAIDATVALPGGQSECQVQVVVTGERVFDERDVQRQAEQWSALYRAS